MGGVRAQQISHEQAYRIWKLIPDATVFTRPDVAERLGATIDWWAVLKGNEPFALWPVAIGQHGRVVVPEFSYHFGPMWTPTARSRTIDSQFHDRLAVYSSCLDAFRDTYVNLEFETNPNDLDVRAFSWWNFNQERAPKFEIAPRFTAQIKGLQQANPDEIWGRLRAVRRREITWARQSSAFALVDKVGPEERSSLYQQRLEAQGLSVGQKTKRSIDALLELALEGAGFIVAARQTSTDRLASAAIVLRSNRTANLVLSTTAGDLRNTGVGPFTTYAAIETAKAVGDDTFDFNGANSPKRGDDKHSFGAKEALYFRLSVEFGA